MSTQLVKLGLLKKSKIGIRLKDKWWKGGKNYIWCMVKEQGKSDLQEHSIDRWLTYNYEKVDNSGYIT